jgi:hypothetical protein
LPLRLDIIRAELESGGLTNMLVHGPGEVRMPNSLSLYVQKHRLPVIACSRVGAEVPHGPGKAALVLLPELLSEVGGEV